MLQVELKKILFHHKGLLLLLISLAAYAVFCVGSGYDSSYVIDRNEDTYLAYMDRWQGEVTEEKAQEMETEYAEATRSDDGRKAAFLTIMYWCLAPDGRRWWRGFFDCIFWDFPAQGWQRCSMAAAYYLRLWHWRKRGRIAAERRKASGRHLPYAKY